MKILIVYFSQSGNTKKIAKALHKVVSSEGHQVTERAVAEITPNTLKDFDLVFLGSACRDADLAEPIKEVLEKIDYKPNFKMAGFVTHGAPMPQEDSERRKQMYNNWAGRCIETFQRVSSQKGFDFLGYFHCMGAVESHTLEAIHQDVLSEDEDEWDDFVAVVSQHPNAEDLEAAKAFAKEIIRSLG